MFVCQHTNRLECLIMYIHRKKTDYSRFSNQFCTKRLIDSNLTILSCLSSDCVCKCSSLKWFSVLSFCLVVILIVSPHRVVVTALFIHTAHHSLQKKYTWFQCVTLLPDWPSFSEVCDMLIFHITHSVRHTSLNPHPLIGWVFVMLHYTFWNQWNLF